MLRSELARRFLTISEIESRMDCCKSTARKYMESVDRMLLEDDGKMYYDKDQAVAVIKSYLKVKKERLRNKRENNVFVS